MTNETVYLIDGTSICYRSFYALSLSNSKGLPTGAVYGFYQTLKKIHAQFNPQCLVICFDVSRKTFRQEKFKEYKMNRPPAPEGLNVQIPLIKRLIGLMGLARVEKEGFEADDIIYTLTKKAVAQNRSVVIVTSDKDMYQLLGEKNVAMYNPVQERLIQEEDFAKEFGFASSSIVDYLALAGDTSDNIPGAKGIGKVGASKLIQEYRTIENMFARIDTIAPKTQKVLIENKPMITLSKELAQLVSCDVDLNWKDMAIAAADRAGLCALFTELEFKRLVKDFAQDNLTVKLDIKEITASTLKTIVKDTLTFFSEDDVVYVPGDATDLYRVSLDTIKDIMADETIKKISYDFKEQLRSWAGIPCAGIWFDVKIAAYVDDPTLSDYSLEGLVAHYMEEFVSEIPTEAAPYYIHKLYIVLAEKINKEGLENLFFTVEMPLVEVLHDMESWGIAIDIKALQTLGSQVQTRDAEVSREIFALAGKEFNLNSPAQLRVVLFEELKIPPLAKTKTGYSTNEEVLTKLAPKYPITRFLLEHRELAKIKTTYILPILEAVKLRGGKLHTTFNQTATQTGRLSSSSPNLQSIPAHGTFSTALRRAFISSFEDGVILTADYSQIELRILAHFSADAALERAFSDNTDIHRFTASLLFGISQDAVSTPQRDTAKKVNFGILYGMSAYGLAAELGTNATEAQNFIDSYFLRYPGVKTYIERTHHAAETNGYVTTILHRRRNLADIKSQNQALREFARRQAINTPIQGSCADIIKTAMIRIERALREQKCSTRMIIQIHDELVFDVPAAELTKVKEIVREEMEKSIPLRVPLRINIEEGKNWANTKEG